MGKKLNNEADKSQLAKEICDLAAHQNHINKLKFINWYHVLSVNENADADCIRKQYHKLALQLHPDKNHHSLAETAFKLVSEAYMCLSDNARRAAFDSEKKINGTNYYYKELQRRRRVSKELTTKLKEEALVINKCLNMARKGGARRVEMPIFDPKDYYEHKGYPHPRTLINRNKMNDHHHPWSTAFMMGSSCINSGKSQNQGRP